MHAYLVAGLGFGDEGKGTIVDSLVRETGAKWVVRYNGGAQAAHHVVTDDGITHCFSQFGAGTLAGAHTYLSRFTILDPVAFMKEDAALQALGFTPSVIVDEAALVTTPYHRQLNQVRELTRGDAKHGSCGRGIGEARRIAIAHPDEALRIGDLKDKITLHRKLQWLRDLLRAEGVAPRPQLSWLTAYDDFLQRATLLSVNPLGRFIGPLVFEGAQGVLLDETYGFFPHTTWTNTTFDNAETLLHEAFGAGADRRRIGVTRAYHTRHGAGPFPSEGDRIWTPADHNIDNPWQGRLRAGALDAILFDYAVNVLAERGTPVTELAVTWMDTPDLSVVDTYEHPRRDRFMEGDTLWVPYTQPTLSSQERLGQFLREVRVRQQSVSGAALLGILEGIAGCPVGITSYGPQPRHKTYHPAMTHGALARGAADATI